MWLALTQNTHNKSSSRHGGDVAVAHGEGRGWVWWSDGLVGLVQRAGSQRPGGSR